MMFSYPYFNSPYYHRYSRYGYYYPNASYAHKVNNLNTNTEQPNRKHTDNVVHTQKKEEPEIEKGHSGVTSYKYSHKRCPYKRFFLYNK